MENNNFAFSSQVLTSGAPVLVQPAGPGGTVHLMLRPPTPTLQSGPGPPQNKMIITNSAQAQPQHTVFIQNRQQVYDLILYYIIISVTNTSL